MIERLKQWFENWLLQGCTYSEYTEPQASYLPNVWGDTDGIYTDASEQELSDTQVKESFISYAEGSIDYYSSRIDEYVESLNKLSRGELAVVRV